jgi:hypothetical protein
MWQNTFKNSLFFMLGHYLMNVLQLQMMVAEGQHNYIHVITQQLTSAMESPICMQIISTNCFCLCLCDEAAGY